MLSVAAYWVSGVSGDRNGISEHSVTYINPQFVCLWILLLSLYYLGHRPDWDDANFLNLAAKAPVTHGRLLQLDTMVGDGPHPIHLPSYRLQSYELLGAVLAFLSGLEPAAIFHLILPFITVSLLAAVLCLVMSAVLGGHWLGASLLGVGLLYANTETFTSWGMNGLLRFYEGKGPVVTLIPLLSAALTVRWFIKRNTVDLVLLGLVHVSAIGLSANGLFISPAASGFVALAFVVSDPRRNVRAGLQLVSTLLYPVLVAAVVILEQLALPSEVTDTQAAYSGLRGVIGWRLSGLLLLLLAPMYPLVATCPKTRKAAAIYLPVSLLILLSPPGWSLASALSGNLGFRFYWAIPVVFIAGAAGMRLLNYAGLQAAWISNAVGVAGLALGILANQLTAGPSQRVAWHAPDLKVPRQEYDTARRLAALTPPGCKALVPENYAVWIAGLREGPYLITVRDLYLKHYRFTQPHDELAIRWALFRSINDQPADISRLPRTPFNKLGDTIGLIATERGGRNFAANASLARHLGLRRLSAPFLRLEVWRGQCAA
jgi:hypothetical protein